MSRALGNKTKLTFKRMLNLCVIWKQAICSDIAFCLRLTCFSTLTPNGTKLHRHYFDDLQARASLSPENPWPIFHLAFKAGIKISRIKRRVMPRIRLSASSCSSHFLNTVRREKNFSKTPSSLIHQHLRNHYLPFSLHFQQKWKLFRFIGEKNSLRSSYRRFNLRRRKRAHEMISEGEEETRNRID